jgi:ATP-dependent DNA helicase RecQ
VMALIEQLVESGDLERVGSEYPVLELNDRSWEVMRSQREAVLLELDSGRLVEAKPSKRGGKGERAGLTADERRLFEALRAWRRGTAERLSVPPYVVFSDATLEALAKERPRSEDELLGVYGIGQKKLADFGTAILREIRLFLEGSAGTVGGREGQDGIATDTLSS